MSVETVSTLVAWAGVMEVRRNLNVEVADERCGVEVYCVVDSFGTDKDNICGRSLQVAGGLIQMPA